MKGQIEKIRQYIEAEIQESVETEQNKYLRILKKANPHDLEWMNEYGKEVTESEKETAVFYFSYPKEKICRMAEHITDAFFHGFTSQNRERGERKRVRLFYRIGQEALAVQVAHCIEEKGLLPVVIDPVLERRIEKEQFDTDSVAKEALIDLYEQVFYRYQKETADVCGMIGIGEFGEKEKKRKGNLQKQIEIARRKVEEQYVRPSELSFCKVVFPSLEIGKQFQHIFDEIFEMNLEQSEEFEKIQQILIDGLDQCLWVRIIGKKPNQTYLDVQMQRIENREQQTNFMNCGGDLNIPYGEVFTTPQLKGTNGLLHIQDIFLQDRKYHNLKLWFEDGEIVDFSCEEDGRETKGPILESLFYPYETLPVGEFAIGTNTLAFRICKKYQLEDQLPILIYEKMGPHLAIGDPCYKGAEEEPVYNLLDGKEITAKYNEKTRDGKTEKEKYVQKHIDITIPYDEISALYGYTEYGEKIFILKDGKFILPGTDKLNHGMEERQAERL